MLIAGVDEVGRGPLAGPVIAAAVIFPPEVDLRGITDSKKLTPRQRESWFTQIQNKALCWAIGRAEVAEIDQINILQATLQAMHRAIMALTLAPAHILVDGIHHPPWSFSTQTIINGDTLVPCISAASILAKVVRDAEMVELGKQYPEYGFEYHKGYGTERHLQALKRHGPLPGHHRWSFSPVRNAACQTVPS